MKVYFDTCSLHRPLDNTTQLRVALEAEAVLGLLTKCEADDMTLVSSEILVLEVERNQQPQRRAYVMAVLEKASIVVAVNDDVAARAKSSERRGFKAFDALHIASAEFARVDYFCSCDDGVLKKSRRQGGLAVKVVSPLELAKEVPA